MQLHIIYPDISLEPGVTCRWHVISSDPTPLDSSWSYCNTCPHYARCKNQREPTREGRQQVKYRNAIWTAWNGTWNRKGPRPIGPLCRCRGWFLERNKDGDRSTDLTQGHLDGVTLLNSPGVGWMRKDECGLRRDGFYWFSVFLQWTTYAWRHGISGVQHVFPKKVRLYVKGP